MKNIYLIRHGETDLNRRGIVQGSGIDSPLNEVGRMQAHLFFERYKEVAFDKIYTSTLKRAQESVSEFASKGIPLEKLSGLNEISWGKYEGAEPTQEVKEVFTRIIGQWSSGQLDERFAGGESPNEVAKREQEALDSILSRFDEKTILICMHGRAMRMFLCLLTGIPLTEMDQFLHANLSLYRLDGEGNLFKIIQSNSIDHLRVN